MATRWKMDADDFLAMVESKSATQKCADVEAEAQQLTDAERQAIEYCERVARLRERGEIPDSYTATTYCAGGCGWVYIFQGAPSMVDACPWCINRAEGLPIPIPQNEEADHGV